MFSSAQGTTEVEVIQLKRLFSATKSRLVRTQANRPLHVSQWYEQMWKTRFTVHVPPPERALAEVQWHESLRPFHLKTCGRVRDSKALMLFKPSTFLSIYIETVIYVYFMLFADLNLSRSFSTFAFSKDWKAVDCPWPATSKESFLGLYWRNFIISHILSCIVETLGEGINFV